MNDVELLEEGIKNNKCSIPGCNEGVIAFVRTKRESNDVKWYCSMHFEQLRAAFARMNNLQNGVDE